MRAQYTYSFDHFGNLAERGDVLDGATETESYDALNRLKKSILTLAGGGGGTTTYAYDDAGDLTSRSDRGSYSYGENGAGPHAVTSISDGSTFAYNANGEMTADSGKTLTWAAFGQAIGISQGGSEVELGYDAEDARDEKTVAAASGSETVRYLGAAERIELNGQASIRRTLTLADMTIIDTGGANAGLLFPISDHLGSTIVLGDDDGQAAASMSYGPFGERMTAGWAADMSVSQALTINQTESDRGYTGQEGLDAVGLWDDNARLYDSALGRFLSVDPLIAHPESTQGINPYSYVENNPLNATDPTGMADSGCTDLEACGRLVGAQGSWIGPNEVKDAVNASVKSGAISGALGSILKSVYHAGAYLAGTISSNAVNGTDENQHNFDGKNGGDSDMARMSSCVYHSGCQDVGNWSRLSDEQLKAKGLDPGSFSDAHTGFQAGLFFNGKTDAYTLAFAGTNDGRDLHASELQMAGLRSVQFDEARNLTQDVLTRVRNNLTVTGHSLGGALAATSALYWGIHGVTFNAEGLSQGTITRYGLGPAMLHANTLITAYHTAWDPLTFMQDNTALPDAVGRQVTLPGFHFHSISGVCTAMNTQC